MKRISSMIWYLLICLCLVACDSIPFFDNTADYKSASRGRPLEVPPDLTAIAHNDTYAVPTTYSNYNQHQEEKPQLIATPQGIRIEKSGGQRWLVVSAPVEKVWPVVREFWLDLGFAVRVENSQIGLLETEWTDAETIQKDKDGNVLDKFDKWLDKLSGFMDKKKFRTRVERGAIENTTEIYLSHRSVTGAPDDGKNRVQTQLGEIDTGYRAPQSAPTAPTVVDSELDAELLSRLMIKLGVTEQQAKLRLAEANKIVHASVVTENDGSARLIIHDSFDRAWRRVGLALDRIGFVTEDKDRSQGILMVRYADVDIDDPSSKRKGWFDKLKFWGDKSDAEGKSTTSSETTDEEKGVIAKLKFWGKDDKKANKEKQYRLYVSAGTLDNSSVIVLDEKGAQARTVTANRILGLLYEQLK